MKEDDLLKRVSRLGYPLFESEQDPDTHKTLSDIVRSRDLRLWEGFPVVLANAAEQGVFDHSKVYAKLTKSSDRSCLSSLLLTALALYRFLDLKFSWAKKLYKTLPESQKTKFKYFLANFKADKDFKLEGHTMSSVRLKAVFNNYFRRSKEKLKEYMDVRDNLSLEFALSQVFSAKQKELFFKKLKNEKLTKTEREYYSRTVKKKVFALAHSELYHLAQKIAER